MEKNRINALDDILIIKDYIGKAQGNCNKLYKILMAFGIFNLIYYVTTIISAIMFKPNILQAYFTIISNATIYIVFLIYYIKIFREEKTSSNKYYLSFLSICAGVTFLLPVLLFIIRMIIAFDSPIEKVGNSLYQLQGLSRLSNILLLCFCIIICGYILKKKVMTFISAVVLFIYLILSLIYNDISYTISFSEMPATISLFVIYYSLAISIGYIIIAMILKYGENNMNATK